MHIRINASAISISRIRKNQHIIHLHVYLEITPVKTNFCARSFSVRRRLSKLNTLKKSDECVYTAIICI